MPHPSLVSILERSTEMSGAQMAASLVPPRQFDGATFDSYRPDPAFPSQAEAVAKMRAFSDALRGGGGSRGFFGKRKAPEAKPGIYLDGGFGVGKTHLLAALWRSAPGRTYFGTFIEYTALVGALGYARAVESFRGASLIAIDEFELDDPGDTMMMTRLLGELAAQGTRIAATSNTPPNALGEGRFAAVDFLREIQNLADRFDILRIDGEDYRRRDVEGHAVVTDDVDGALLGLEGEGALDDFGAVVGHLSRVHPSRYIRLVEGLTAVGLRDVRVLSDQADALRFVAFVDRLYDEQVRIVASGTPLDQVFAAEMLEGGYRKKYLRAISRLIALTN